LVRGGSAGPPRRVRLVSYNGTVVTSTSATYAAPTTGTAATSGAISVVAGQKLLVTIYTSCQKSNAAKGCYMSFDATSTGAAGITQSASDSAMAGGTAELANTAYGQSVGPPLLLVDASPRALARRRGFRRRVAHCVPRRSVCSLDKSFGPFRAVGLDTLRGGVYGP